METITSRSNALVKRARAAREGKDRELIFVEGVRLCEEAATAPSLRLEEVLFTPRVTGEERGARLLSELRRRGARPVKVSEDVLGSLSDTKTPQGVILLARRPPTGEEALSRSTETPLIVVMHRIGNPSNAGAMLRVAEAAGATGVITTEGTTDVFAPKALRGAMGSSFRLPLWTGARFGAAVEWCAERGIEVVGTALGAARAHTSVDWTRPRAVLMGAEGAGLAESERSAAGEQMMIPMRPPVESLNVAVALAVVLYEAARQRRHRGLVPAPSEKP